MELTRRNFLQGASVLGVGAAVAGLTGCSPSAASKASTTESAESPTDIGLETKLTAADATTTVDIVVLGSGAAGVSAAVQACEEGMNVALLDRGSWGGSTAFAEGILGLNTDTQKARGISNDIEECVTTEIVNSNYLANIYIIRGFLDDADANLEWLKSNGVPFMAEPNAVNPLNTFQHFYDGQGKAMVAAMVSRAEELGAILLENTRGKRLIMEDDKVSGIVVEGDDGEYVIATNAVVLATGGFIQNSALFEENFPYDSERIVNTAAPGHEGDGYLMAKAAGGDQHGICAPGWVWAGLEEFDIHSELSTAACNEPYLWVNEVGERFVSEALLINFSSVCNALLSQRKTYSILSQTEVDRLMKEGCTVGWGSYILTGAVLSDLQNELDEAEKTNPEGFYSATSIKGLAEALGIDETVLTETLTDYSAMAESGVDTDFSKPAKYLRPLPLGDSKYYAFELMANATNLTGGVVVNEKSEVVTPDGKAIGGLYAAGCDASGLTGFTYVSKLGGSKQQFSVWGGRTAAQSAAEYLNG